MHYLNSLISNTEIIEYMISNSLLKLEFFKLNKKKNFIK